MLGRTRAAKHEDFNYGAPDLQAPLFRGSGASIRFAVDVVSGDRAYLKFRLKRHERKPKLFSNSSFTNDGSNSLNQFVNFKWF